MADKAVVHIRIDGAREVLTALNRCARDTNARVRDASQQIARDEAQRIQAAGLAHSPQAALVAMSVRARRDRVPAIAAGGSKRAKPGVASADIFFGAEFGGRGRPTTQQFRPHRGTQGHWFYPTLRGDEQRIEAAWLRGVDAAVRGSGL